MKIRERLTEPEVRYFRRQAAAALQHQHKLDFFHMEIKPQNLFLTDDMIIKLGDLGLAENVVECDRWWKRGTIGYMTPEVVEEKQYQSFALDIWSLRYVFSRWPKETCPG